MFPSQQHVRYLDLPFRRLSGEFHVEEEIEHETGCWQLNVVVGEEVETDAAGTQEQENVYGKPQVSAGMGSQKLSKPLLWQKQPFTMHLGAHNSLT